MAINISQVFSQLRAHVQIPLYFNAYALILNQVASAGLGVLYWLVAARLYSTELVGQNSATISTVMFLAALADLGLNSAMTRFIPRAGNQTPRLILYAYGANVVAAGLIGVIFFWLGGLFQFTIELTNGSGAGWLVLTAMVWSIFSLQDGVMTGMRQSIWVLIKNSIFNLSKLILLLVGGKIFLDNGIAGSWFLPTPFLIVLINGLLFWKFMPRHLAANSQARLVASRQMLGSIGGDYIGSFVAETCVRMLPLLVINEFGKSANAFFYQAWLLASIVQFIAIGMTSSFTVEASAHLDQIAIYSQRILKHMARLVIPLALVLFIVAPIGLGLYGEAYAREGAPLLQWLALAQIPIILNSWYISYSRVRNDPRAIIFVQSVIAVLTLGISYTLTHFIGLGIIGIGIAWVISQTLVAGWVFYKTAPILLNRVSQHAE